MGIFGFGWLSFVRVILDCARLVEVKMVEVGVTWLSLGQVGAGWLWLGQVGCG